MRIYLLFLILVATLFIAGCLQTGGPTEREYVCPDGKTTVKSISQCPAVQVEYVCPDGKTTVKSISQCPSGQVVQQQDPEMKTCEEMPDIENMPFIDSCYMGLAYKRENATLCKKLSEYRKIECYSGIATLKNDVTICDAA